MIKNSVVAWIYITFKFFQKILKNVWKPTNPERIAKHDKAVLSNWKAFKLGKLSIPDENLKNHLKQFVNRDKLGKINDH